MKLSLPDLEQLNYKEYVLFMLRERNRMEHEIHECAFAYVGELQQTKQLAPPPLPPPLLQVEPEEEENENEDAARRLAELKALIEEVAPKMQRLLDCVSPEHDFVVVAEEEPPRPPSPSQARFLGGLSGVRDKLLRRK